MDWFEDGWGDGFKKEEEFEVPQQQPNPIGHETTATAPITAPIAAPKQTQAPGDPTHYEPPKASFNQFDTSFGDDWGDSNLQNAMSSQYIMQEKTQPTTLPSQSIQQVPSETVAESSQVQQDVYNQQQLFDEKKKEAKDDAVVTTKEEEAVEPEEPRRSPVPPKKEPAQAERNFMGTGMGDWGKDKIQNLGKTQPVVQSRANNRKRPQGRKGPMKKQAAVQQTQQAPVQATQQAPVGSAPSKVTASTEPSSVPQADMSLVQSLMEKVRALEMKVEELENRQIHQIGGVCTLNSTGKVNHDMHVVWDTPNHIIRPQKGLKLIEPDLVFLEVSHRGLYQITFTTCGSNPQLVINGHVYAAARSATASGSRLSSTSCVNIYLYLDEKATIAGKVTTKIASENPCEHWMCVRLVHQGF